MKAILLAGGLSLIFTLLGTRLAIRVLARKGYGQLIRDDGPTTHHTKRGTPTMGGLVIILSVVLGLLRRQADHPATCRPSSALLLLFLLVGLGIVGFLDDYIKIAKQRSLGLRSKAKMAGQIVVAVVFGGARAAQSRRARPDPGVAAPLVHPRLRRLRRCPRSSWSCWILVMIAGTSNAVNLTDGLDGLATGASTMVFGAYTLVNIWQNNQCCALDPGHRSATRCATRSTWRWSRPRSPVPASASCGGTPRRPRSSWATPGRSSLGGALAGFAILTRTELLLVVLGGLFVIDHAVGDPAGRLLQAHRRQTDLPDGAAAAPLRAAGLGRDHRS